MTPPPRITVTYLPPRESPEWAERLSDDERAVHVQRRAQSDRWEWDGWRWIRRLQEA
jgi:hypothetical protein